MTHCLGLGIVGLTQGGEHLNKKIKKWVFAWTCGRGNYIKDMMEQMLEIWLGGLTLFFQDFKVGEINDILEPNTSSWHNRFAYKFGTGDECTCCNRKDLPENSIQLLKTWVKKLAEKKDYVFSSPRFSDAAKEVKEHTAYNWYFICKLSQA